MAKLSKEFIQLQEFLKEMFQFEEHDLDFGIYRITRLKRKFIENFIDGDDKDSLRAIVTNVLQDLQNTQGDTSKAWLNSFSAGYGDKGNSKWKAVIDNPIDDKKIEEFQSLFNLADEQERDQAETHLQTFLESKQSSSEELETKVYNHLLNFFELYYQNGDFGYNSRAASAFKIPYEINYDGSDTLFHWKHKDSYYIKSGNGFHSVRCEINGKWLEFRLKHSDSEENESTERNNNKDDQVKQYKFIDIVTVDSADRDGKAIKLHQVRFELAKSSTTKVDIYQAIWNTVLKDKTDITPYLHKKPGKDEEDPGKPIFNDLKEDYDKAEGGQIKGIGQLRIKLDKYLEELAKREEFKELGSNKSEREKALAKDNIAHGLWYLDRSLNKFYVGMDADYFIHKDLQGFLTREKNGFIKQVIYSDLDALLHAGDDNTTALVAKAFNEVAEKLISFLGALEEFQKGLFEIKKKVVDTHYLISIGKIPESFYERIYKNKLQISEWAEIFKVEIKKAAELDKHPTLVVDTSLYSKSDPEFQDDLISLADFDNLDEQIDGLLINSENWQALNLLTLKFNKKIDLIEIDPPYNTGDDGFIYKDSFKDSSWLSFVYDRLYISYPFLKDSGSAFFHIDDIEHSNFKKIISDIYGAIFGNIVWEKKKKGSFLNDKITNVKEYIIAVCKDNNKFEGLVGDVVEHIETYPCVNANNARSVIKISKGIKSKYKEKDFILEKGSVISAGNMNLVLHSDLVIHDNLLKEDLLIEGNWRYTQDNIENYADKDELYITQDLYIRRIVSEPRYKKIKDLFLRLGSDEAEGSKDFNHKLLSKTGWGSNEDANNELMHILGSQYNFPYPKPIKLVSKLIASIRKKDAYILDFMAGSGTTGTAVLNLNQKDKGFRKFILVEMGSYFRNILFNRIKRYSYSKNWERGKPSDNSGSEVLIKVQLLEQYEDLLDNLAPIWDDDLLPNQIPVKYLFRPEQNALSCSLDLSKPFTQTIRIGKSREEQIIDLMETWCYLQGHWIKSKRIYRATKFKELDRNYLIVETTHGTLVMFRDIEDGEDDTKNIEYLLKQFKDESGVSAVEKLEINHDVDRRKITIDTTIITAQDFMRGVQWN